MKINTFQTLSSTFLRKFSKKQYKVTPAPVKRSHFGDYTSPTQRAVPAGRVAMSKRRRYA